MCLRAPAARVDFLVKTLGVAAVSRAVLRYPGVAVFSKARLIVWG